MGSVYRQVVSTRIGHEPGKGGSELRFIVLLCPERIERPDDTRDSIACLLTIEESWSRVQQPTRLPLAEGSRSSSSRQADAKGAWQQEMDQSS
jgi:hypothetical protein